MELILALMLAALLTFVVGRVLGINLLTYFAQVALAVVMLPFTFCALLIGAER